MKTRKNKISSEWFTFGIRIIIPWLKQEQSMIIVQSAQKLWTIYKLAAILFKLRHFLSGVIRFEIVLILYERDINSTSRLTGKKKIIFVNNSMENIY